MGDICLEMLPTLKEHDPGSAIVGRVRRNVLPDKNRIQAGDDVLEAADRGDRIDLFAVLGRSLPAKRKNMDNPSKPGMPGTGDPGHNSNSEICDVFGQAASGVNSVSGSWFLRIVVAQRGGALRQDSDAPARLDDNACVLHWGSSMADEQSAQQHINVR